MYNIILERGINKLDKKNKIMLSEALEDFNYLLKSFNPCDLQVLYLKIICLRSLKRFEEAEEVSYFMESIDENNLFTLYVKARLLSVDNKTEEARAIFKRISDTHLDTNSQNPVELVVIAFANHYGGYPDRELPYLLKAFSLGLNPLSVEALANIYHEMADKASDSSLANGYAKEAIKYYEMLKNYWPDSSHIYSKLGELYHIIGDSNKVIKNYEKEELLLGEDFSNHLILASHYHDLGNFNKAYEYSDKYLDTELKELNTNPEDTLMAFVLRTLSAYELGYNELSLQALETLDSFFNNPTSRCYKKKIKNESLKELVKHTLITKKDILQKVQSETFASKKEVSYAIESNEEKEAKKAKMALVNSDPKLKYYYSAFVYECDKTLIANFGRLSEEFKTDDEVPGLKQIQKIADHVPFPGGIIIKALNVTAETINTLRKHNKAVNFIKILGNTKEAQALIRNIALDLTLEKQEEIISYQKNQNKILKALINVKDKTYLTMFPTDTAKMGYKDAILLITACSRSMIPQGATIQDFVDAILSFKELEDLMGGSIANTIFCTVPKKQPQIEMASLKDHKVKSPLEKLKFWKKGEKTKDTEHHVEESDNNSSPFPIAIEHKLDFLGLEDSPT